MGVSVLFFMLKKNVFFSCHRVSDQFVSYNSFVTKYQLEVDSWTALQLLVLDCWRSIWSAKTNAAIASTIGTALGTTHGSCRPFAFNKHCSPSNLQVTCVLPMVAGGLKATRKTTGSPLLMPPWMPPLLFVIVASFLLPEDASLMNKSLCSDPLIFVPSNPLPISNPETQTNHLNHLFLIRTCTLWQ